MKGKDIRRTLLDNATLILIVVVVLTLAVFAPSFFTLANIINLLSNSSILLMVSIAMCITVVAGGTDLCVAGTYGLGAMAAGMCIRSSDNMVLAIVQAAGIGIVIGLISGLLITKAKISIWLTTLGMLFICESIEKIRTNGGNPIYLQTSKGSFNLLGKGAVFTIDTAAGTSSLKLSFLLAVCMGVVVFILLEKTNYGRKLYATGFQRDAARLCGVPIDSFVIAAFMLSGAICAFAGVVNDSQIASYIPVNGRYYLLDSIGAVFVGSTLNKRGKATIPGTMIGVIFFKVVSNGLNLLSINYYWHSVILGVLIYAIVAIDAAKRSFVIK